MKICAFGRDLEVRRDGDAWTVLDIGNEGKKRLARDIHIPSNVSAEEVSVYLGDLLHEHASARYPEVVVLD